MRINNVNKTNFKGLAIISGGTKHDVYEIITRTNASSQGLDEVDGAGYFATRFLFASGEDDTQILLDVLDKSYKELNGEGALDKALINGDRDTMLTYIARIRQYVEAHKPKIPEFSAQDVLKGLRDGTFDAVNLVFRTK